MQLGGVIPGAQFVDPAVLARIGNLELVRMRGGFATAFGLEIEFSVLARTTVDGQTVLSTVMNFNGAGGLLTESGVPAAGAASPDAHRRIDAAKQRQPGQRHGC